MKPSCKAVSAAVLVLAALQPAQAVVVNSGFGAAGSEALAAPFSNVVRLGLGGGVCTGTLISATTILTAKHCTNGVTVASMTVTFDQNGNGLVDGLDQINQVSAKFEAPDASGGLLDGTDLAMLTLSGGLPSWATAAQQLFAGDVLGALATMVGYGGQGIDALVPGTAGGTRRAAENVVDVVGAAGVSQPFSANIISTDFDNGSAFANTLSTLGSSAVPLLREGTTAGGDSGGPLLVNLAGNWLIAGVLSGGTNFDSSFGDISWWTGVSQYRTEIEARGGVFFSFNGPNPVHDPVAAIPEPETYAMMLLGLSLVMVAARRRRH